MYVHLFSENRTLELHSPDGVHSCVLRAADATEAAAWFNTLHSALAALNTAALQDANRALCLLLGELQYIGWLVRKPPAEVTLHVYHCFFSLLISSVN